jgi:hypothetical protein
MVLLQLNRLRTLLLILISRLACLYDGFLSRVGVERILCFSRVGKALSFKSLHAKYLFPAKECFWARVAIPA